MTVDSIVINASPDEVWAALLAGTGGWYFDNRIESSWVVGEPVTNYGPAGDIHIHGVVVAIEPARRLVTTFRPVWVESVSGAPTTEVEWRLTPIGPLTRLTLTHRGLPIQSPVATEIAEGWVYLLSNLKTVLETGKRMPPPV